MCEHQNEMLCEMNWDGAGIFSGKGTEMTLKSHISKCEILSFPNKVAKNNDFFSLK